MRSLKLSQRAHGIMLSPMGQKCLSSEDHAIVESNGIAVMKGKEGCYDIYAKVTTTKDRYSNVLRSW